MVCNSLNRFGLLCKGLEITQTGFCKDHAIPALVVEAPALVVEAPAPVPIVEAPAIIVPAAVVEAPMYQCKSQTIAKKQCKLRATVDGFCSRHSTTNPSIKCQALMKPCSNNAKTGTQYCGVHSLRDLNQQIVDIPEFIFGYHNEWRLKTELGFIKDPVVAMKIRESKI